MTARDLIPNTANPDLGVRTVNFADELLSTLNVNGCYVTYFNREIIACANHTFRRVCKDERCAKQ